LKSILALLFIGLGLLCFASEQNENTSVAQQQQGFVIVD